ncbi:zinc finger protein [Ureibacillus sp. FSL K6-8385]|uniref:RanBP2-type domain-containing protein n=1 Tax=Ureibacillus terrenus TaxID=118246 RepID=A0A540V3D6_9BACL|nr:zinc ribbon domain-containing protein [Ureibacillus terrenus]MED3763859.1 zinc finger protein [Ureibacillus terrenus]TQE91251.1 hypothetical protein FKZ59_06300 [Ureibacillus terrenus]
MPKWSCPKCYHLNNSHATYCLKCGYYKEGQDEELYFWKCPVCNEENSNHTIYCIKCGHHYSGNKTVFLEERPEQPGSKWKRLSENVWVFLIMELLIIGIAISISVYQKESVANIFSVIFFIHLFFGMYYIIVSFVKSGYGEMMKSILIQGVVMVGLLMIVGMANGDKDKGMDDYSLNYLKDHAMEVDYDELHHIAFERYGSQRKQLVNFIGKVFLVDGGEYLMIDMSKEPGKKQVVYVKRKEWDAEVNVNDRVEIYGKVLGTASAAKHLDEGTPVPVVESYSLELR